MTLVFRVSQSCNFYQSIDQDRNQDPVPGSDDCLSAESDTICLVKSIALYSLYLYIPYIFVMDNCSCPVPKHFTQAEGISVSYTRNLWRMLKEGIF